MLQSLLSVILIFTEVMPSNVDVMLSPTYNFDSWVEVYNPSDEAVNLGGCYLSNDASELKMWKMPADMGSVGAKSYRLIWLGNNDMYTGSNKKLRPDKQAPFKLSCDGGSIYISDMGGNLLDALDYPAALSRTSYARTSLTGDEWAYNGQPTPGAANNASAFASERLLPPVVSHDGQLFTGTLSVKVTIPEGATLRYTTDGSVPTLTNSYVSPSGNFTVSNTRSYRFRLFRDGYLPSVPVTRSYIKRDKNFTVPVVSVVCNKEYLESDTMGVMVRGTNGRSGNGQEQPCNWNMDWERPVNFQYILPDQGTVFNQDVELSVSGGWSRATDPHSFKLKSGKEFDGQNSLNYTFFDAKPYNKNKVLLLRNGGNDAWCRIKDAAVQEIIRRSGVDIDVQAYRPVVHYINGQYKGVINLREPNNKKYVSANFGYDDDRIDMFEMSADSNVYMMVGTSDVLDRIYELGGKSTQAEAYEELKQLLDIDEFVNYMAMELYIGSTDWPHNNIKGYRSWDGGKYRFITFDLDFAFYTDNPFVAFGNDRWHTFNYMYDQNKSIREEIKLVTFFLNMLNNADFRRKFIDAYCLMGGSVFQPERCNAIINELADRVRPMLQLEGKNPDGSAGELRNGFASRMESMMTRLQQFSNMRLSGVTKQSVRLGVDTEGAQLYVNGQEVPYASFEGKLFAPVTLRAEAPAGYTFAGWRTQADATRQLFGKGSSWAYYDKGSLGNRRWYDAGAYSANDWSTGRAPLGYGVKNAPETTTISYGGNASQKHMTYYFRKTVDLTQEPTANDAFQLQFAVDDGFVVYVNGVEAGRYNMPEGTINFNTGSSTYAADDPLTGTLSLNGSLFRKGSNLIAVEVHNTSLTSSDIYWDAALLTSLGTSQGNAYYSTQSEISLPTGNNVALTACFQPLDGERKPAPVRINEVSPANDIHVNEYFKRNDWVELYNTTDADIDVEGMYLTDNAKKPQKWQITKGSTNASTVVPAHGYLIIWCDKLEPQSQLHASFKLAAEGGIVRLTAADESWADQLDYGPVKGDETVGRYPDGTDAVWLMNVPTIARRNLPSSYMARVEQTATGIGSVRMTEGTASSPSSLLVRYAAGSIVVRGSQAASAQVSVFTLSGQRVLASRISLSAGYGTLSAGHLPAGCYIVRVTDADGQRTSGKIFID